MYTTPDYGITYSHTHDYCIHHMDYVVDYWKMAITKIT